MRYGLPYKGSKNQIAEWIIGLLPRAETFVDLFFGGGAVTHAAMVHYRYNQFIANDIDGRLPELFLDCAYGKYTVDNHSEWISRQEFNSEKAENAYIALIWSFGNNGKDYLYAEDIEPFKKAFHCACFYDDLSLLVQQGIHLSETKEKRVYERYIAFKRQLEQMKRSPQQCENLTRLIAIERLQSLQSLQRLQSLQSLQRLQSDYSEVKIPKGALIYCDVPYSGTNCGKYDGFNSKRFYEWAEKQDNIFISEYNMPDDFIMLAETEKDVLSAAGGTRQKAKECIYTNKRTYRAMSEEQKNFYKWNNTEQLTFA